MYLSLRFLRFILTYLLLIFCVWSFSLSSVFLLLIKSLATLKIFLVLIHKYNAQFRFYFNYVLWCRATSLLSNIILIEGNPLLPDFLSTYNLSISLFARKFPVMVKIVLVLMPSCLMSSAVQFTTPTVGVIIGIVKLLYAVTLL